MHGHTNIKKEDQMGGEYGIIGVEDKCIQGLSCGGREEKIQLWKHKLSGRIILK